MEIETKNGSKIEIKDGSKNIDFGRGSGFNSTDLTVSRRHISFKLHEDQSQTRVYFEVNGKNPIWVHDGESDEVRVYRSSESGEMKSGDSFCVSSKNPVWFNLKRIVCEDEDEDEDENGLKNEVGFDDELAERLRFDDVEIEAGDCSHIDPVKEFGFVVMGHEFDSYQKKLIRDIKNWAWFLEEPKDESEDDDEISERRTKKGTRRKRKKGGGEDDDDVWTGESEDAEVLKKLHNTQKPKYSTRSKDREKNKKGTSASKSTKDTTRRYTKNNEDEEEDEDEDDEDDETLGGFIVDDEEMGEGNDDDEEDEEEFEEDDEE